MRFNRLFYQILVVFVVVIIMCLAVSGWYMLYVSKNIITQKISNGDQNFAGQIAQEIEAEMASVKPTLALLAASTGLRLMEAPAIKGEIDRVQKSFSEITSIYVANMEGEQIARTGTGKLENMSMLWNFQVARGGDELVSDIYLKPTTSEPIQTITLPIIDNGVVVGVLSADISFRRIMASVMGIDIGKNVNVIVVADNGRVVAHTRMKQVPELDLSRLPVVEAVLDGQEGTMKGYTDELGCQVLGSYMPIRELGWGVVIQRPLAEIDVEFRQLRTTILWAMIFGIFLSVLAGTLMSRQITKPIRRLASASERVAQGDLSTLVDVKSSNEVGVLAHSFNQMIVSLKKSRDELQQWGEELEEKVAVRTEELARANVKLKELDHLKSMFIASMSHELRTPLNSIIGFTSLILKGMAGKITDEQRKQLMIVKSSANHLLELITDVIDVSKIEADQIKLFIEDFDLFDLIQEVKDSFKVIVYRKGLKLSLEMPEGLVIKSDSRRVKQIIMNLVSNAIKFTEEGEINIKVEKKREKVYVSVADSGIGIKKENMKKLFKQFSRIYTDGMPIIEGTGLGLYLSKKIADLLGAKIRVESEFGKGSVFTLTLPSRYVEVENEKSPDSRG